MRDAVARRPTFRRVERRVLLLLAPSALCLRVVALASDVGLRMVRQRTRVPLRKQAGSHVLGTLTALELAQ